MNPRRGVAIGAYLLSHRAQPRDYDEWDPNVPPYVPYGLGPGVSAYAGDEAIDDWYRKH